MDNCPDFGPADVLPLLFAKVDLATARERLGVADDIAVVRHRIIATARSPEFVGDVLRQVPDPLAPACVQLLDSWYVPDTPDRHQLARLRRVMTAIASLRTVYGEALNAC